MSDLQTFLKDKKVLITGHSGFKGGWLAKILSIWGSHVTGVSLEPPTIPNFFEALDLEKAVTNYFFNIDDYEGLKNIFEKEKPEIVFHLAAQPIVRESYDKPLSTFMTNIMGTAHVLEISRLLGTVHSLVVVTSDKVYRNTSQGRIFSEDDGLGGLDPYSASKSAADIVSRAYLNSFFTADNSPFIAIARAGNTLGGGDWGKDRLVTDMVRSFFETRETLVLRNPRAVRPWIFVLEVLEAYLMLSRKLYNRNREIRGEWNFGPEEDDVVSVKDLVERGIRFLGTGKYEVVPDATKNEAEVLRLNSEKAKQVLGWKPRYTLQERLERTLEWYKTYYREPGKIGALTMSQINEFFN